jgi:4-hydroxy-tetrahydrodipicolinate synthase
VLERRPLIPALKGVLAAVTADPDWGVMRPPLRPLPPEAIRELLTELRAAGFDPDGVREGLG